MEQLKYRFYNCGERAVVIVAVVDAMGQWAAYMGIVTSATEPTSEALDRIADGGLKMREDEATGIFPFLARARSYRR